MEGGSLAPGFSSDGSGLPDNTDFPEGNLRACLPTPPKSDALGNHLPSKERLRSPEFCDGSPSKMGLVHHGC